MPIHTFEDYTSAYAHARQNMQAYVCQNITLLEPCSTHPQSHMPLALGRIWDMQNHCMMSR